MFRRLPDAGGPPVAFTFDGLPLHGRAGDSVAAALLAAGHGTCRETPVSGAARGPYCLMGTCFECLVEIDGIASRQACMTPLCAGMRVARQRGRRRA